jgi:hypothetical protein
MRYRFFQQLRLWIYATIMVLLVLAMWGPQERIFEFVAFCLICLLPFLEICPVCGGIAWFDQNKWPNALWIGAKCRRNRSERH